MNDVDFPVQRVLDGIDAAAAAGLPVKVNAVIKRGLNDALDPRAGRATSAAPATRCASSSTWTSARRTAGGSTTSSRPPRSSSGSRRQFPLEPVEPGYRGEVAKRWRYTDGGGEIGLISSVTQPFCGDCTRARISAEGRLYTCLFGVRGHDLRALVRGGASDEELHDAITGDLGQAHRPLLRAALGGDGLAAEGRDELHRWLSTSSSSRSLPSPTRRMLELADAIEVDVPRGEPRKLLAAVADALAAREPAETLARAAGRGGRRGRPRAGAEDDEQLAHAVAYRLALPYLARHAAVKGALAEVEPLLADLFEEEREERGPALARAAVPALAVDVELLKDEGYRYVATFPPEGSEGVDVVGKAAAWLTRRMTVDGDDARLAMRRFLAVVAEEIEVELPLAAETIDRILAEPMPAYPPKDRPFLSLARGLVEEADRRARLPLVDLSLVDERRPPRPAASRLLRLQRRDRGLHARGRERQLAHAGAGRVEQRVRDRGRDRRHRVLARARRGLVRAADQRDLHLRELGEAEHLVALPVPALGGLRVRARPPP